MDNSIITIIVAVVAIAIVWKLLTGLVKTLALLAIAGAAALFVSGGYL